MHVVCRNFVSQRPFAWAPAATGQEPQSEGQQPLAPSPAADREEVWQTLYALHSLYEVGVTHPTPRTLLGAYPVPDLRSIACSPNI